VLDGPPSKHNYTTDDVHSVALALQRGTDINCDECYTSANMQSALAMKLITEDMIDLALRRTMVQLDGKATRSTKYTRHMTQPLPSDSNTDNTTSDREEIAKLNTAA
jgi:hypothetical protein